MPLPPATAGGGGGGGNGLFGSQVDLMEQSLAASSTLLPRNAATPRGTLNPAPPSRGGRRQPPPLLEGSGGSLGGGGGGGGVDEIDALVDSWQQRVHHHPTSAGPAAAPASQLQAEQSLAGDSLLLQLQAGDSTRQSQQLPAFGSAWATDPFAAVARSRSGLQAAAIPEG